MLKKMGIGIVMMAVILCMTTGMGMAEQSSLNGSIEEILIELQGLQEELGQWKEAEVATEDIKGRLQIARAKEEVLYKLGVQRYKLISVLIAKAEERAKEQAEINEELRTSIGSLAKRKANVADVEKLKVDVEELRVEVSLAKKMVVEAKKMAAAAQVQANQAKDEVTELAQRHEEDIAMLMAIVNDLVIRVQNLEERLGEKPVIKLKPLKPKEISVK